MKASFVIGFHTARADNLLQTLRFLTQSHEEVVKESQLVTVCQDTCDNLTLEMQAELVTLQEKFKGFDHSDLKITEMMLPFVTNHGVERTASDKIIILESDRLLTKGYFSTVINQMEKGLSITTRNMRKLKAPATDADIRAGKYEFNPEARSEGNQIGIRNMWSGNTAIWKADYYEAGRMDEEYVGYGWADSDMTNRMASIGVKSVFRDEMEIHLWHPPATYGETDQKRLFISNGIKFCKRWGVTYPDWFKEEIRQHHPML